MVNTKKCSKCNEIKNTSFFSLCKKRTLGVQNKCKECVSKYYFENKEKIKQKSSDYARNNKLKIKAYQKEYNIKNKDKMHLYNKNYVNKKIKNKEYYLKNKETFALKSKIYYEKTKGADRNNKIAKYQKERMANDPLYKMTCNLRHRIWSCFKSSKWNKNNTTKEMLGQEYEFCKKYIETKFDLNMTWNNYGKWHIDHIIPLSSAKSEQELINLCHYTNLQPLWANENHKKSSKIINIQLKLI